MCHCYTNPDGTVVVCDSCAAQIMTALMDLLPEEEIETPSVLTSVEYRGMTSAVNGWLDELEVATR